MTVLATELPDAPAETNSEAEPISLPSVPERPETFNLAALVREHVVQSKQTDPQLIADEVFAAIDPRDYPTALRACLRTSVRKAFGDQRRRALGGDEDEPRTAEPVPPVQSPPAVSAKVAGIRRVRALLEMRVNVGDDQHKHLADCTVDDLNRAAGLMRGQASALARRANQYDTFAVLLQRHRATRVSDLSEDLLLQATR